MEVRAIFEACSAFSKVYKHLDGHAKKKNLETKAISP